MQQGEWKYHYFAFCTLLTIIGSDLSSSSDIWDVVLEVILEVEWCSERLEHCDKL